MKKTTFNCERKGCQYKKTLEIDSMMNKIRQFKWPNEFTMIKTNNHKYHLCPNCNKEHNDIKKETQKYYDSLFNGFINGKKHTKNNNITI